MSEKGQSRKSMFVAKNMEELRRLYDTDTPVLAYAFKRQTDEGWTPEHGRVTGSPEVNDSPNRMEPASPTCDLYL